MKIIAWNCNGAFRKKNAEILSLNPDILIVSECENLEKLKIGTLSPEPKDSKWFGENSNKGIGVFAYGDYTFELSNEYNPKYKYVIPLRVHGQGKSFLLLCVWTKENKYNKNASYIGQVWYAINYYSNLFSTCDTIIIGDFNSNKQWDHKRPETNHSQVVQFLKRYDIESLYHLKYKENQGEESAPTFFLHKKLIKPYHIDYCFASKEIHKKKFDVEIGVFNDWIHISDHVPVIVKLDWEPSNDSLSNSLYDSINHKFNLIKHGQFDDLSLIKKQILNAAASYDQNGNLEAHRLRIIQDTEDLLAIFNLIKGIKARGGSEI